jgi:hypothetical protein
MLEKSMLTLPFASKVARPIVPHHKEAAMIGIITGTARKGTRLHTAEKTPCIHSRMVDDLLTKEGNKTGQLICVECRAVFLDPMLQNTAS